MEKKKIKLTQELWAKILAFVLLALFTAALLGGVLVIAVAASGECYAYSSLEEALGDVKNDVSEDVLFWLDIVFELRYTSFAVAAAGLVGAICCIVFLFCAAGRRKTREDITLNWLDKLPTDVYLVICGVAAFLLAVLGAELIADLAYYRAYRYANQLDAIFYMMIAGGALCLLAAIYCTLAFLLSLATRVKAGGGIWWRNTAICWALKLCWRAVRWCWGLVKRLCGWLWYMTTKISIVWRTALIVLIVLVANFCIAISISYSDFALFCWLLLMAAVFLLACFGAWQMKSLKAAGEKLAAGEFEYKIDTKHMYWEFKHHAENLNSIGDGMAAAVEQRMKSERLKTELITNVSHDIKTPLTSIINYVDLLERPHTPEEGAEYLEVLERQSKRLKKLTEDLVEASKASTGNMSVTLAPTSTLEIINQSLAEYGQRMEAGKLSVLINVPEPAPAVRADGRLLWRVMDNLFNNVVKYAMPETRVYVDVRTSEGNAVISVKNISRAALNVSAEELMERFVRGDTSRSTEGSGLGLSIAKSLTELQHGQFNISTDGDLFKAEITLPLA